MKSALFVYSRHTKKYVKILSKNYKDVSFFEVKKMPTEEVLKIKNDKDLVIGIGGGSVIDTAKIISKKNKCIAIPTTASGASVTPYATIWGKEKKSILTKTPILKMNHDFSFNLPTKIIKSTLSDALSHAVESFWSKNVTSQSKKYSEKAIYLINRYIRDQGDIKDLITAGNMAGKAIAITKTNIIHAVSYPVTILYGINHGIACGMLLPHFVNYFNFKGLPKLFNLCSTNELVAFLQNIFSFRAIKDFDVKLITKKAMKYSKVNDGPKPVSEKDLIKLLSNIVKEWNH